MFCLDKEIQIYWILIFGVEGMLISTKSQNTK